MGIRRTRLWTFRPRTHNPAWGNVTWAALARSTWDVAELAERLLAANGSLDLLPPERVAWLREERVRLGAVPEEDALLARTAPNHLRAAKDRDHLYHFPRQVWLYRLATRFWSG